MGPHFNKKKNHKLVHHLRNVQNFLETYRIFLIKNSSLLGQVDLHLYQYKKGAERAQKIYGTFLLIVSWKLYRRLKKFGEYIHKR